MVSGALSMVASRLRMPVVMLAKKKHDNHDPPAKKYCFRATVRIIDTHQGRPFGVFTAYDTNLDVSSVVENACEIFRETIMPERLVCEPAEIVLHKECPVELTHEIHFTRIVDVDSDVK